MSSAQEKILDLVSQGKISGPEADELLAALKGGRESGWRKWQRWLNPLEGMGTWTALTISLAGSGIGVAIAHFRVVFDGALDVHIAAAAVSPPRALAAIAFSWLGLSGVLFAAGALAGRPGRFIDHLNGQGLARLPLVMVGLVLGPWLDRPGAISGWLTVALSLTVGLPCAVGSIFLAFQGFKTASGLKGSRLAWSFVVGAITAEAATKLLLHFIA